MNFIKNHKVLITISSIVFVVLLTAIILIFTLFSLKTVTLDFKTETNILSEDIQQEIMSDVSSEGISTVLFVDKDRLISNLEKDYPYLRIINIETIIPSGFVIHCAEREELYAIESEDKVYYLDEDMKILRVEEGTFTKTNSNAVLLNISDLDLNMSDAEAGQFLTLNATSTDTSSILANNSQVALVSLLTAFEENNRDIAVIRASYQSFTLNLKYQQVEDTRTWYVCLSVVNNVGFKTEIVEANKKLAEKLEVMLNITSDLSSTSPETLITNKLTVYEDSSNQIVYLLAIK